MILPGANLTWRQKLKHWLKGQDYARVTFYYSQESEKPVFSVIREVLWRDGGDAYACNLIDVQADLRKLVWQYDFVTDSKKTRKFKSK